MGQLMGKPGKRIGTSFGLSKDEDVPSERKLWEKNTFFDLMDWFLPGTYQT